MTVREIVSVLKNAKGIQLSWNSMAIPFDPNNELMMDAYGDYVVQSIISGLDPNTFEVEIATRPIRAGHKSGEVG